jgi:hypothetical protein
VRADHEHLAAVLTALRSRTLTSGASQRTLAADDQHRVGFLDPGEGRVEVDRGEVRHVVVSPVWRPSSRSSPARRAAPWPRTSSRIEQVAGDRRDACSGALQRSARLREAPRPSSPRAACRLRGSTALSSRVADQPVDLVAAPCRWIHSSLTSSLMRGSTRITAAAAAVDADVRARPRRITSIAERLLQLPRPRLEGVGASGVSAPTGHRSIDVGGSSCFAACSR